jgi:hypothetical protein
VHRLQASGTAQLRLQRNKSPHAHPQVGAIQCGEGGEMLHLAQKIEQAGATGYILLWLLGIPIPILILIFLLRGYT